MRRTKSCLDLAFDRRGCHRPLVGAAAEAAELKVLSASAIKPVLPELAEAFRRETGQSVTLSFATAGEVERRLVAGIHFANVIERLGIAEPIRQKAVLGANPDFVCVAVAKGEVELCVHQISEIRPVKGVTLVGPLPKDVQRVTTFAAAVSARSSEAEAARAFVAFVSRPAFKARFAEAGLDYRVD